MSSIHPLFDNIIGAHFPRPPKVQPCDHCGPEPCDYFPCEQIQNPRIPDRRESFDLDPGYGDPQDMRLEALP